MISRTRLGLPLMGVSVEERDVTQPPDTPGRWYARQLSGWRFQTSRSLIGWPSVSTFGSTLNAHRVNLIKNVLWGHGIASVVRHGYDSFSELYQGAWATRNPAAGFGGSTATDNWGGALIPSTDGKGRYMFSNRIVGPYYWDGAVGIAVGPPAASNPCRYVVSYADRAMLFNLLTTVALTNRSCQWSIAGDGLTFAGTGSGDRDFTEFEGEITGAAVLRRSLMIYHRFGLVVGNDAYNVDNPVSYSSIITNGIGNIASNPTALLSYNDIHAFLSEEGFRSWDGGQINNIGAPIDNYIMSNINRSALSTVCGFVKPDWHIAAWALPMGTSSVPTELWAYDFMRNAWHSLPLNPYFSNAPTAFGTMVQSTALTLGDAYFAGMALNNAALTGKRLLDFAGGQSNPIIITGHDNGTTNTLSEATASSTISLIIDTPSLSWEGYLRDERGARIKVDRNHLVTIDEIDIAYRTISGSGTLYSLISTDGGQTFTPFGINNGLMSFPSLLGDRVATVRQFGRITCQNPVIRLTNIHPVTGTVASCPIRLEDIGVSILTSGFVRAAVTEVS